VKKQKHRKQKTWTPSGSAWNAATPFNCQPLQKYAQAATGSAPLKMSAVTPLTAGDREILIRSFDERGEVSCAVYLDDREREA
jgi:hypothetical protein